MKLVGVNKAINRKKDTSSIDGRYRGLIIIPLHVIIFLTFVTVHSAGTCSSGSDYSNRKCRKPPSATITRDWVPPAAHDKLHPLSSYPLYRDRGSYLWNGKRKSKHVENRADFLQTAWNEQCVATVLTDLSFCVFNGQLSLLDDHTGTRDKVAFL